MILKLYGYVEDHSYSLLPVLCVIYYYQNFFVKSLMGVFSMNANSKFVR